jgi:hypothetical protein
MSQPREALVILDHLNGIIRRSNYERFTEEACSIGVAQFADRGQAGNALIARKIVRLREPFQATAFTLNTADATLAPPTSPTAISAPDAKAQEGSSARAWLRFALMYFYREQLIGPDILQMVFCQNIISLREDLERGED